MASMRNLAPRLWSSLLAAVLAAGCDDTQHVADAVGKQEPSPADVAEQPESYLGKKLTLVGEVHQVGNPRAFELESNRELFGDDLLVLSRSPVRFGGTPIGEDDEVVVVGRVRELRVAEMERELGWDLEVDVETEWKNKAVLIAESVSKIGRYATWDEAEDNSGVWLGFDTVLLAPDPQSFIGDRLRLADVTVQSIAGGAMWVGPSQRSRILVVPVAGMAINGIEAGSTIDLQGTVRPMPKDDDALRALGLDGSQAERLKDQIAEELLYIQATEISRNEPRETKKQHVPSAAPGDVPSGDSDEPPRAPSTTSTSRKPAGTIKLPAERRPPNERQQPPDKVPPMNTRPSATDEPAAHPTATSARAVLPTP